ncbi:hypothetical protein NA57DRAFT_81383 [Rhizodiscina lignyota]|uniref:Uncharacterized protein n=1 Tax=Rhizodiscina lignyota TaxID=1504668 RepID=A0A9P4I5B8_9PEZI|nr:hypothetical protein NA57DRAFT_81383 [Rhizodiscina lignyota]
MQAALDVMDGIQKEMITIEDTDLMIKRIERAADMGFRRSYAGGQPVREVLENAPILKVGLSFLPGADRPTVNRLEQTNMMTNRDPDQMDSVWRVNTAGSLLSEFEVTPDLSVIQNDKTAEIAEKAMHRLSRLALTPRSRPVAGVTIDSEQVKVDIDSAWWPRLSLDDTKAFLESMMEDVRRLFHRSPLLFRLSTRSYIINSRNTRYGIKQGRQFKTLTTSKGIQEMISLSAAYYNTLDVDGTAQKFIRPRFLQMLTLLLSLLNDDDLSDIRLFLESTYKFKADRSSVELLFLKVLPLLSINPKVFMMSMIPVPEGWPRVDSNEFDFSKCWDAFIAHMLPLDYILPGTYSGPLRTFNDVPRIDQMIDREDDDGEITVVLTNDEKYIIRAADYERIVCLVPGVYTIKEAHPDSRDHFCDLEIQEIHLNDASRDAVKLINPVIKQINSFVSAPIRRRRTISAFSKRGRPHEISMLKECRTSGRLAKHTAGLDQQTLAVAYKVEGRKITLSDAVSIMAQDDREVQGVVNYYRERISDNFSGVRIQNLQHVEEKLHEVDQKVQSSERMRQQIQQDPTASDEPIASVIQQIGSTFLVPSVWYEYKASSKGATRLDFKAITSVVSTVTWRSDSVIEISLQNQDVKYFASPLEHVDEALRDDQVRTGDVAVLAGQYMILAEEGEEAEDDLILTNYLKITNVEEPPRSQRGANRRGGRGNNRGVENATTESRRIILA